MEFGLCKIVRREENEQNQVTVFGNAINNPTIFKLKWKHFEHRT